MIFYVVTKKSYVITTTLIPSVTFIRYLRVGPRTLQTPYVVTHTTSGIYILILYIANNVFIWCGYIMCLYKTFGSEFNLMTQEYINGCYLCSIKFVLREYFSSIAEIFQKYFSNMVLSMLLYGKNSFSFQRCEIFLQE